ncbi:TPA: glycosyltransferase family 2 protein [Klebsiella pneumoniae]|nr:glycosyltransferase [Klebsiella pneumoniae]AWQ55312.1 rhamnosyltransferase [Klebsiella pneumoniae]AXS08236.1 glycosyltransferase family 2 protein [Klebsiella pneumoniae]EKU5571917.1 glycosyltransferase family 2 protein [Klebsiella pneumoniae]EKU8575985.1 glycosyltransferase family 2 protein [Klebsiella pneumoniae]EKW2118364.1 glycosyltransferase family 2 protein [Klebsiella pneumoniae]
MKYFIAIPTYNGGDIWKLTAANIKKYSPPDVCVKIVDSGSKDNTIDIAQEMGFEFSIISSNDFNHGGTRNLLAADNRLDYDVVIFMTQDAIPEPNFIQGIISVFDDPAVACAYGRQIPHDDANPIASHARSFNYTMTSYTSDIKSIHSMGLKAAFMSNSFSAYRISSFKKLGGFPSNTILCEDMYFAARALLSGHKVAYVSNSIVKHSHNYSPFEEFKRYFDIGVFHKNEPWIREKFGSAGGEGKRFIISEIKFLLTKSPKWLFLSIINNFMKIAGYKLGQKYDYLPLPFIKKISMHKRYWNDKSK